MLSFGLHWAIWIHLNKREREGFPVLTSNIEIPKTKPEFTCKRQVDSNQANKMKTKQANTHKTQKGKKLQKTTAPNSKVIWVICVHWKLYLSSSISTNSVIPILLKSKLFDPKKLLLRLTVFLSSLVNWEIKNIFYFWPAGLTI